MVRLEYASIWWGWLICNHAQVFCSSISWYQGIPPCSHLCKLREAAATRMAMTWSSGLPSCALACVFFWSYLCSILDVSLPSLSSICHGNSVLSVSLIVGRHIFYASRSYFNSEFPAISSSLLHGIISYISGESPNFMLCPLVQVPSVACVLSQLQAVEYTWRVPTTTLGFSPFPPVSSPTCPHTGYAVT